MAFSSGMITVVNALLLLVVGIACGCDSSKATTGRDTLANHRVSVTAPLLDAPTDLLSGPYGFIVQHNTYYVFFSPKEGLRAAELDWKVVQFLSSGASILNSAYSDDNSQNPFRVCDFWALVLTQLRGSDMTISMLEANEARDRKIVALLRGTTAATRRS
jgi:hypothetical protein